MSRVRKGLMMVIAATMILATGWMNVTAYAENTEQEENVIDIGELGLASGESTVIDGAEITCIEDYTKEGNYYTAGVRRTASTTKTDTHTSHYIVKNTDGSEQTWYDIYQITNYTYDGRTVTINRDRSKFRVTKLVTAANCTVLENMINNYGDGSDATYKVKFKLKLGTKTKTYKDITTVTKNGKVGHTHQD